MFLTSSKLLAFLTLLIITAVTDADSGKECDASWKAYGFDKKLNDAGRTKVRDVIRQIQGVVNYTCEHERIASQIRDKVVAEDSTFANGIELVFAARKKLRVFDEVEVFPEGMLEARLQKINIVASSFGCARSDGIEQPPPKNISKPTTTTKNKKKNKKQRANKPKKQKGSGKAKKEKKRKSKKNGPKPSAKPTFVMEPIPLKAVYFVCVYRK